MGSAAAWGSSCPTDERIDAPNDSAITFLQDDDRAVTAVRAVGKEGDVREDNKSLVRQLTVVATLGGLLFGYDTAVISGAVGSIDANFIAPQHLTETARDALSGWTVSSALLGCIIGAATTGWISTAIGRRAACSLPVRCSWFPAGSAYPEIGLGSIGTMGPAALTPFILYRILCGVGVGIASMLAPLYIAEIAPSEIRGRLVSFNQLSIVLGMPLVYFVNWAIASQGDEAWIHATGWRLMLLSEAAPVLFFLLLLTRVPDTPRWYAMKGRPDQALAILRRLVGEAEANLTLAEIQRSLLAPTRPMAPMNPAESTCISATTGGGAHVAASSTRLFTFGPLVIVAGILLSVLQQLVGINAVLYYAPPDVQQSRCIDRHSSLEDGDRRTDECDLHRDRHRDSRPGRTQAVADPSAGSSWVLRWLAWDFSFKPIAQASVRYWRQ